MIDIGENEGRALAHFMYSELEKIARLSPSSIKSQIESAVRAGVSARNVRSGQRSALSAAADTPSGTSAIRAGLKQFGRNRSIDRDLAFQLSTLDDLGTAAQDLLKSDNPVVAQQARGLLDDIQKGRNKILGRGAKPAPKPKPSTAPAPKKPTAGERFDRVANLTGKGVLLGGAGLGAYTLYDATKPKSPYANY